MVRRLRPPFGVAFLIVALAGLAVFAGGAWAQQAALMVPATALLIDGSDVNLLIDSRGSGTVFTERPILDVHGHATLDTTQTTGSTGIPRHTASLPWAGYNEWVGDAAVRNLRYCATLLRGQGAGWAEPSIVAGMRAKGEQQLSMQPIWENCNGPDVIIHADVAHPVIGCGIGALGCFRIVERQPGGPSGHRWAGALSLNVGALGQFTNGLFVGTLHEFGHGLGADHCGPVAGEPGQHHELYGHPCDMSSLCGQGSVLWSCSNPNREIAWQDHLTPNGGVRWGLSIRINGAPAPPAPAPSPAPAPAPTAPPTPAPTAPPTNPPTPGPSGSPFPTFPPFSPFPTFPPPSTTPQPTFSPFPLPSLFPTFPPFGRIRHE